MTSNDKKIMKRMVEKTEIICVQGDLFSYEEYGIAGMAISIPEGLTGIRCEVDDFIKKISGNSVREFQGTKTVKADPKGILKALVAIDNGRDRINNVDDMRCQVEKILNIFKEQGVHTIGMNGIRCDNRPDAAIRPEQYQVSFIEDWIKKNPDAFDQIFLIDLRGGFNK